MINKELKRLSRRELVDIIYQLKKNEQEMQEEVDSLKNELQDRRLRISVAGSIADATISMTNLFSTAQMTADIYLREIASMKEDAEKECMRRIEEAEKKAELILADGEKKIADLQTCYENEYKKLEQLKTEVAALEQKYELYEDIEND